MYRGVEENALSMSRLEQQGMCNCAFFHHDAHLETNNAANEGERENEIEDIRLT